MKQASPARPRVQNVEASRIVDIACRAKLIRIDIGATSSLAMSKLMEMSPNAWKWLENGSHLPSSDTLLKLVDRGYDPTWLLTGRGSMLLEAADRG